MLLGLWRNTYLKLFSLWVCVSQITSQIVDFFTSWLPVIIDYQLQEVYLNQSLLFTAFYDSLLKVKIYKQGADSAGMKLIKLQQTCSALFSPSLVLVKVDVVDVVEVDVEVVVVEVVELTDIWRPTNYCLKFSVKLGLM